MLITITLISGLSIAEDSNASTNEIENGATVALEPTVVEDTEVEPAAPEAAAQGLEGSWILFMDDAQIQMVIYQSEDLLFGAANSETPQPWNGVVSGSVSGDEFELQILSLQDGVLVSTLITGTAINGDLSGDFVQSDSKGKVNKGIVRGIQTSPDTSGYEPAVVPDVAASTVAPVTQAPVVPAAVTEPAQETTTSDGRRTPVDVTTLSERYIAVGAGAPLPL